MGQHTDLDPADHGLGAYPATRLNCPGARDPHAHVKSVAAAVLTQLASRSSAVRKDCEADSFETDPAAKMDLFLNG